MVDLENSFRNPVIIVGAPRSGTSLLQRIIRGAPGFVSVAKESGLIWRRYTDPERHNWTGESFREADTSPAEIERIHRLFARYALPWTTWRKADDRDVLRYQRNPFLSALLYRPAYHLLALSRAPFAGRTRGFRLVDKSVHSGLWLPFVERVFPDATFIHITRDPRDTVGSMVDGWLNPNRFFTYTVPLDLAIPDYPYDQWNFALHPGWQDLVNEPLARVVTHQWSTLTESIMEFRAGREDRWLTIRLEDLTTRTETELRRLTHFLDLPWDDYFERCSAGLPKVNARGARADSSGKNLMLGVDEAVREVAWLRNELGYQN